jgi:hypothetical protein
MHQPGVSLSGDVSRQLHAMLFMQVGIPLAELTWRDHWLAVYRRHGEHKSV